MEQNRRFEETLDQIKDHLIDNITNRESKRGLKAYGLNVLDLMSGKGRSAKVMYKWWNANMSKRVKTDGTLWLVDYSNAMLEQAKTEKFETNPQVNTYLHCVKTLDWNVFNTKFDVVIGWWNLCYLRTEAEMQNYVKGLRQVLA